MHAPIIFEWTDEGTMKPLGRFKRACDKEFAVGALYPLIIHEQRSQASHNFFFASIAEVWKNLPEELAERFATPDHLRKHCLILEGYRDERTFVASSKAEALRLAAFVKPMDEYAVVVVRECVVVVWTAQSQSRRAMGGKTFNQSKEKVLDRASAMIGVTVESLAANTQRAA